MSIKKVLQVIFIACVPVILFCFISGCGGETECEESTITSLYANFYQKGTLATYTDSLAVHGFQNDSLLYDTANIKSLTLILKLNSDTTIYVLDFLTKGKDTITFVHENSPHYISETCGCTMFYNIDSVIYTSHYIDSLSVINKNIINEPRENIQLFFR